MREDVLKFLFIGPEAEKEKFFKQAQAQGIIHFIDPSSASRKDIPQDIHHLTAAIKVLRGLPPGEQEENLLIWTPIALWKQFWICMNKANNCLKSCVSSISISPALMYLATFLLKTLRILKKKGTVPFSFSAQGPIYFLRNLSLKIFFCCFRAWFGLLFRDQ